MSKHKTRDSRPPRVLGPPSQETFLPQGLCCSSTELPTVIPQSSCTGTERNRTDFLAGYLNRACRMAFRRSWSRLRWVGFNTA